MTTAREALRKLCKGRGDAKVEIYRRPLRKLLEIAEAAEEYRTAQSEHALLVITATYDEREEQARTRARAAQANLDELLRCLDVPA